MPEKNRKPSLTVNVRLEQATQKELPDLTVYAFDSNGQFLTSKPLPKGETGQAKLELPSELDGNTIRVAVGPPQAEQQSGIPKWMEAMLRAAEPATDQPTLAGLRRKNSIEKGVRLSGPTVFDLVLWPPDWAQLILCPCVVRGCLVKKVALPDGTIKDLGVCHACVKIYEVDKFPKIIYSLPDAEIYRLRDDLIRELDRPPEPVSAQPEPLPIPKSPNVAARASASLSPLFLAAASATQLRSVLAANAAWIAPIACGFPWLMYTYKKDLIRCCCTDEQGRFSTVILYRCSGDKPDLYFKAVQCIGGSLHTLYDPGIICHTHWDYVCGTEVALTTTDPAAITCAPDDSVLPPAGVPLWVMPYGVGGVRLDRIKASGLTDFGESATSVWPDVPFGGTLGFRHGYSSAIPFSIAGKPALYRWRYNKLTSLGAETEWREFAPPVASTVIRYYVDYDLAHPELPPAFPAYVLGPMEKKSMHLYEFRPHDPPAATGHQRDWPVDNWFGDIYSGILQSTLLPGGAAGAAGSYKVMLQVYDKDANLLVPGPGTFEFIVPTGVAGDGVTVLTRKALAGEIEDSGFVFILHVDNNVCEAAIHEARIGAVAAGPCGFIAYTPGADVHLSFKANHPNGFARFKFTTARGSSGYVNAACAPPNPDTVAWSAAPLVHASPANGFVRAAGVFSKDVDETLLRGGCPKAAFAENLYVAATAIDGWNRLSGYDASATPKAFALEPAAVPAP